MPNFTYSRDIPFEDNNPSEDQPNMKTNTNSTDSIFDVDHFSFNNNKGGSHKQVTLTNEAAPGLGDGNGVLHANLFRGQSWPYWQNALGDFLLLSGGTLAANTGFSYISQGILLQWGQVINPGTSGTVVFPTAFPSTNPPFTITLTLQRTTATQTVTVDNAVPPSSTSFKFLNSSAGSNILYWFAIGN